MSCLGSTGARYTKELFSEFNGRNLRKSNILCLTILIYSFFFFESWTDRQRRVYNAVNYTAYIDQCFTGNVIIKSISAYVNGHKEPGDWICIKGMMTDISFLTKAPCEFHFSARDLPRMHKSKGICPRANMISECNLTKPAHRAHHFGFTPRHSG